VVNLYYSIQFIRSQIGFEKDGASPAMNLTARHCKNIYSMQWIQGTLCFSGQAQVTQKSWI